MKTILSIRSFLKFLNRNKAYTAINIFGLSISLMFVILIAVYTIQELSVDKIHKNSEDIVVIASEEGAITSYPIASELKERYPEINKVCAVVFNGSGDIHARFQEKNLNIKTLFTDSTFFDIFSFPLIEGTAQSVLNDQYNAVVSESFAKKMFENESPIGKHIYISDSTMVYITGVMKDIKNSMFPETDVILRAERTIEFNRSILSGGNAGCAVAFLRLNKGANLDSKKEDMLSFFKETFWIYRIGIWKELHIHKFDDLYFSNFKASSLKHGDKQFVTILLSVGILILIFALFNYINLTVAQAGQRAKEMATRMLLGSSRIELFSRLILESIILTFLSFIIGVIMALVALNFANTLLDANIDMSVLLSPLWIGMIITIIVVVGFISGLMPAALISSAKPIDVVRGTFRRKTKMVFSKFFITFQNTITIATIAIALIMALQINHLINAPLGYNKTNLIDISSNFKNRSELESFISKLKETPEVKRIGFSNGTPFKGTNNSTGVYEGRSLSFQEIVMDSTAFKMFGLIIKQENNLASKNNGWYLTEKALIEMDIPESSLGFKAGNNEDKIPILGIVNDFYFGNITQRISPVMLRIIPFQDKWWPWNIIVETTGDPFKARHAVQKAFENSSESPFVGEFIDKQIEDTFGSQIRTIKIITIFAVVAILISLLGLLAISTYFIGQKSQEIAIRKIFGSDNKTILISLITKFISYVGIAFIIATPISWYIMNNWLTTYSYRIEMNPLMFLAAGALCFVMAFFAVLFQSIHAANTNPIESVKNK